MWARPVLSGPAAARRDCPPFLAAMTWCTVHPPPRAVNCWLLVGAVVTVCGSRAGLLVAGPLPALCALRRSGCDVAFGKGRSFALITRTLTLVVWRCECCVCVVSFPHAIMEIDIITC